MPIRMQDILPVSAETDMTTGEAVHPTAFPSFDTLFTIPEPAEIAAASSLARVHGGQFEFTNRIALAASDLQRAALGRVWPITPAVLIEDAVVSIEDIVAEIIQEAHDAANPWARDIRLVQDQTLSEEERLEALERLADDIPWPPTKDSRRHGAWRVRKAFATYVDEVRQARWMSEDAAGHMRQSGVAGEDEAYPSSIVQEARRDLLGQAIIEVLATLHEEQNFRFGNGKGSFWVHDVPARLPIYRGWFHRWFHAQVISIAEKHLFSVIDLDVADGPNMVSLETQPDHTDPADDDLLRSLATGWDDVEDPRLQAMLSELSLAEREICQLLAHGYDNKEIAAILGKAESTIRSQRGNVQAKARRAVA